MLVLIVEDDPGDALLMERAVTEVGGPGTRVKVFDLGEAAVAYLHALSGDQVSQDGLPDLLLVDLGLPRMSGFEFMEWVRGREVLREIPVVVISAFHNLDADLARKLGASAYFKKPEDVGTYVKILRQALDARSTDPDGEALEG